MYICIYVYMYIYRLSIDSPFQLSVRFYMPT
jgi:hypothetical protein